MSISEFKEKLHKRSRSSGGTFVKTDFHVHAPGVGDYLYNGSDALDLLGQSLRESGYGFAIILQHDEVPASGLVDGLRRHCPSAMLLPGAEINVFVDAMSKKVDKSMFFHCILVGDPSASRATEFIFEKAKQEYTYRTENGISGFHSSVEELGNFFLEEGAIFIPAHLHQSRAPQDSRSIDDVYDDSAFLGFLERRSFSAVEVRQESTARFFDGTHKTSEGGDIPQVTCVWSSDAHHHEHIAERNRATWVQVERRTFEELRAALSFPHRVRLHEPRVTYDHVAGLHVAGEFLPDEWFGFNPQMNCLIGCKGSGKTSVLECLRFILDAPVPDKRREEIQKHVKSILGTSGLVECLVRKADGTEYLLRRRADAPDRLELTNDDGSTQQLRSIRTLGFHVSVLGWHEIEAIAEQPSERVRLVDQIGELNDIRKNEKRLQGAIDSARDNLPEFQAKLRQLDRKLQELWELKRKRSTLRRLEKADLFNLQAQYQQLADADSKLAALENSLSSAGSAAAARITQEFSFLQSVLSVESTATAELQAIAQEVSSSVDAIAIQVRSTSEQLTGACTNAAESVKGYRGRLQAAFSNFRKNTYEPAACTGPSWTAIPEQAGHPIRLKLDSDSGASWTAVPA